MRIEKGDNIKIQILETTDEDGQLAISEVRSKLPEIKKIARDFGVSAILISPNVECLDPLEIPEWPNTAFALRINEEKRHLVYDFLGVVEKQTGINARNYNLDGDKMYLNSLRLKIPYRDEIGPRVGKQSEGGQT